LFQNNLATSEPKTFPAGTWNGSHNIVFALAGNSANLPLLNLPALDDSEKLMDYLLLKGSHFYTKNKQ